MVDIAGYLTQQTQTTFSILPYLVGAIIVLFIGWIVGRLIGKLVRIVFEKSGIDAYVLKSPVGGSFQKTGITLGYLGDIIVRIFVYILAIMVAADILKIESLTLFLGRVVNFIPNIIVFGIILLVGFVFIDYLATMLERIYGSMEFFGFVSLGLRLFLYFVVVLLALSQLGLDLTIVYLFVTPIAWGIGIGVGAGIAFLLGWGLKDRAPQIIDQFLKSLQK
jgi:small-conductance mechanosensitive channel